MVAEGEAAKTEAMDRVERHADPVWLKLAEVSLLRVAKRMDTFTAEDVWDELDGIYAEMDRPQTHEARAMGPIMRAGGRRGWIVNTNRTVPGRIDEKAKKNHARPQAVWQSMVVGT